MCASALRIQQSKKYGDWFRPTVAFIGFAPIQPITMRFAPSQHQSGLLSAFFGLHSIGLFSSAVAGLSAACAIVLPRLPVMRTDVVMAPRAFHPVGFSPCRFRSGDQHGVLADRRIVAQPPQKFKQNVGTAVGILRTGRPPASRASLMISSFVIPRLLPLQLQSAPRAK